MYWLVGLFTHEHRTSNERPWVQIPFRYPCPIHPNRVNSSEALHDSTRFERSCGLANQLLTCRFDNRGNDLCRFDGIELNRQHFQPTLHSPSEVKIHEIMIHILSSFLKRWLQTSVDLFESS